MDSSVLWRHLSTSIILHKDGIVEDPITADMFQLSDISKVSQKKDNNSIYLVEFHGINGTIPIRYFDEESRKKIVMWLKSRRSPLWKVVNNGN